MYSGPPVDFPHFWSMTATTLVLKKRLGEHVKQNKKQESDREKGPTVFASTTK
jgi:hypothetical protein